MLRKLCIPVVALAALVSPHSVFAHDAVEMRRIVPIPLPRPIPAPPPYPGEGWVWVPPVYRTVYDRVWREAQYQTITENVWIPDRWAWQPVRRFENGVWVERQEWVLVQPGHYQICTRRVLISPGGWTYVARQELVSPGRWEWRGPAPEPPPVPLPRPVPPRPPTTSGRPPGLEPFTPLWEWPADSKPEKK